MAFGAANEGSGPVRVREFGELAGLRILPVGSIVQVVTLGASFVAVGQMAPEIAARVGWPEANVWLPESLHQRILSLRMGLFTDLPRAIGYTLWQPTSVHADARQANAAYFIVEGEALRRSGLLHGRSVRFVDAVVESRQVGGTSILRLFHFAPTQRNKGGRQLWP